MPPVQVPPGIEGIVTITELPDPSWQDRWDRIFVAPALKERLLSYVLFSLKHRGRISGVGVPIHGLVVLAGPPGTGKTTLAKIIAAMSRAEFIEFSAVLSGIKEIKQVMSEAERARQYGDRKSTRLNSSHRH